MKNRNMDKASVHTTIHVRNKTCFDIDVYQLEGLDSSALTFSFDNDVSSKVTFFFTGTPQDIVLMLTHAVRELKREHGIVSSDEYNGVTETNAILDDPDAIKAINEALQELGMEEIKGE